MIIKILNSENIFAKIKINEKEKETEVIELNENDKFLNSIFSGDYSYNRVMNFIKSRNSNKNGSISEMLKNDSRSFNDNISIIIE